MPSVDDFPLREKKNARTRIKIVKAAIKELKKKSWKDINVRQIAKKADVSEVTVYNHFPKKEDIFSYIIRIWMLELRYELDRKGSKEKGWSKIEEMFDLIAERVKEYPNILREIRMMSAADRKGCILSQKTDIPEVEKIVAFPKRKDIDRHSATPNIEDIISTNIKAAIENGELPRGTDPQEVAFIVGCVFHGVADICPKMKIKDLGPRYKMMLRLCLKGLRN